MFSAQCQPPNNATQVQKSTKKGKFYVFKGFILSGLSGAFYSSTAVIVNQVTDLYPGQLILYRFLGILLFSLPEAIKSCQNLIGPKKLRHILLIRSCLGATSSFLSFLAFRYLPIGEATVILFSFPALVTIAARIFLKEPCSLVQAITVGLTILGVVFTARIPSYFCGAPVIHSKDYNYGLLVAFIALFFNSSQIILLRKLKDIHHAVILINLGWVAVVESIVLTSLIGNFRLHECGYQSLYIIILGIFSYLGQSFMTLSYQCEFAGPMATIRAAVNIILSFMWQTFIFNQSPDVYSIIGAVLVVVSFVLIGMNKCTMYIQDDT